MKSASYRIRQGLAALFAWARPVEDAHAKAILTPELFVLYRRMPRGDRQHALAVLHSVEQLGGQAPELLTAALLHDVGKGRYPFTIADRVFIVLTEALVPSHRRRRWGQGDATGFNRPFAVRRQHPAWGAEMVRQAGALPMVVKLVQQHAEPLDSPPTQAWEHWLVLLQQADNEN